MNTTLLIQRNQVQQLLSTAECIAAVEKAFAMKASGRADTPGILGIHAKDGGFHIKAGILELGKTYFVSKTNANFPSNKKKNGLPTIQGIIVVSDADNGRLLALMDSIEITIIRTGAATAVAAKYLSRENSSVALICGCGNQGRISLKSIMEVRKLKKVFAFDIDKSAAETFANEMRQLFGIDVITVDSIASSARNADIIVTCTTAGKYFLQEQHVAPGTFIAAVGSDNENKQEVDPNLVRNAVLVTDSTDQCATIGELHHAITAGLMTKSDVYAELGEIIIGARPLPDLDHKIVIFDSTGTALQDVAAASIVYEKAARIKTPSLDFAL